MFFLPLFDFTRLSSRPSLIPPGCGAGRGVHTLGFCAAPRGLRLPLTVSSVLTEETPDPRLWLRGSPAAPVTPYSAAPPQGADD